MVSRCTTIAFQGIQAVPVDVQVMVGPGKMGMQIVGLADKAVSEARERVQSAIHASGLAMPPKRVTVNLAPADLPKEGSHYDLPIALALMAALGALPGDALEDYVVMGELALDGTIAPVTGALPAAIGANALAKGLICPAASGSEAAWADPEMDVLAPRSLIGMANHFKGVSKLARPEPKVRDRVNDSGDLSDIRGQETAKARAGSGSCRRTQSCARRSAGLRQVHARLAPADDPTAAHTEGIAGSLHDRLHRGHDCGRQTVLRPPLSRAAPFGFHGGDGRWWHAGETRRSVDGPQRRALSRRVSRILAAGARFPASAIGNR